MAAHEPFKIYIAVYLVLVKDRQVLLSRRANTGYQDGNYSLVAGHLEGAETARAGIIREAQEEVGLTLQSSDLAVVQVMHRFRPEREYIDIYLQAEAWTGEIVNLEPNKCSELKWFALDNLPANLVPEVKQVLSNIKKKIFYSESGW